MACVFNLNSLSMINQSFCITKVCCGIHELQHGRLVVVLLCWCYHFDICYVFCCEKSTFQKKILPWKLNRETQWRQPLNFNWSMFICSWCGRQEELEISLFPNSFVSCSKSRMGLPPFQEPKRPDCFLNKQEVQFFLILAMWPPLPCLYLISLPASTRKGNVILTQSDVGCEWLGRFCAGYAACFALSTLCCKHIWNVWGQ